VTKRLYKYLFKSKDF